MQSERMLTVEKQGCAVAVWSTHLDIISLLRSTRSKQVHFGSKGETTLKESWVSYVYKQTKDSLAMTLGMWEQIRPQLEQQGWKIDDRRCSRLQPHKLDWPVKPRFRSSHAESEHGELLRSLAENQCGRAEVANENIPAALVALCRLYAGYRILLLVNRRNLFKPIEKYFEEHFPEKFDILPENMYPRNPYRVALTRIAGLRHYTSRWKHDMVVLVDAQDMLAMPDLTSPTFTNVDSDSCSVGGDLIQFYSQIDRVYGFTPVGYTVADCDNLTLNHLCGPLRYTPCRQQQVEVLLLPARCGRTKQYENDYLQRGANYWDNRERNQQIAELATLLTQGHAHHGKRNRKPIQWERLREYAGGSSAILVENLAHANQLAKLLPGWRVVHAETDGPKPLNSSEYGGFIVTVARFAQSCPDVENLLVASGDIPHGHLSPEQFHSFNLVVDFLDHFDADAMHEAEERQRTYRARHAIVLTHPD